MDGAITVVPSAGETATRAALDWALLHGGLPAVLLAHARAPLAWDHVTGALCAPAGTDGRVELRVTPATGRLCINLDMPPGHILFSTILPADAFGPGD